LVIQRDGYFGPPGRIEKAIFADADFLWAYTHAFRLVGSDLFWSVIRSIAAANGLGDVEKQPGVGVALESNLPKADYRFIYCLVDLYRASGNTQYLQSAISIAEAIMRDSFREGWFISAGGRTVNRPEALAILHLGAILSGREAGVSLFFG
jgi:pectate lyase